MAKTIWNRKTVTESNDISQVVDAYYFLKKESSFKKGYPDFIQTTLFVFQTHNYWHKSEE